MKDLYWSASYGHTRTEYPPSICHKVILVHVGADRCRGVYLWKASQFKLQMYWPIPNTVLAKYSSVVLIVPISAFRFCAKVVPLVYYC